MQLLHVSDDKKKNCVNPARILQPKTSFPVGVVTNAKLIRAPNRDISNATIILSGRQYFLFLVTSRKIR